MAKRTLEDIIVEQAPVVCHQLETAVEFAESEEDLRVEFEKAIDGFRKEAGLPELRGHHEVTIGRGRADSVYDAVVIEYKKPGRLKDKNEAPANREVIGQLKGRLKDLKTEQGRDIKEIFGVGTDGRLFLFARYRSGDWEISLPQERSPRAIETFLRRLASLGVAGKPYQAEYLAGDFSAESDRNLARDGITKLYWRIRDVEKGPDDFPKAKVLFDQWKILFGEVCGYDIDTPTTKIRELGRFYGVKKDPNPAALLFSVHTYYALFMKFLAAEIASAFNPLAGSFLATLHQTGSSDRLTAELRNLEDGGVYGQLGLHNFLEGDLFSWYLDAWDDSIEDLVRRMVACFDEYDPKSLSIEPGASRDLLKKLYQQLFPKTLRHDLGEYYTPDWLADLVLDRVSYTGDPDKRVLDPSCGSGTFLVMAINRVREHAENAMIPKSELLPKILANVIGFDLNPLAVMAARTNYLLALRDLTRLGAKIEIPVYLCDSIMTPAEYGKEELFGRQLGEVHELKTAAARFFIPREVAASRDTVIAYTHELEQCVRNEYSADDFLARLKSEKVPCADAERHRELFREIGKLRKLRKNDIWARIIKNAFAPLFVEPVDFVVGNPPWVNWESLPDEYRMSTAPLWKKYGLFGHKGYKAKLGGAKDDISILLTYAAHDAYLVPEGRLGFVITQTVFKTKGGGEGFRSFSYEIGDHTYFVRPDHVDDLSRFQPFEGATNRTAVFTCTKAKTELNYPVPYTIWSKVKKSRIDQDHSLAQIKSCTSRHTMQAVPVDTKNPRSAWLTAPKDVLPAIEKLLGSSIYGAYAGCCVWLNGAYWLRILQEVDERHVLIENLHDVGKIKVPRVQMTIERNLVYPLLRGRDIHAWKAVPSCHILMPNRTDKLAAIPESTMKSDYPRAFAYLKRFEKQLRERSGYKKLFNPASDPFWSIYNIGPYTMSPVKVVWRDMGNGIVCSVVDCSDTDLVLPEHHVMAVNTDSPEEGHYLCAMLNSAPARCCVSCYTTLTGISTHVLSTIRVPSFDAADQRHKRLADCSRLCHKAAVEAEVDVGDALNLIDQDAKEMWGLTDRELKAAQGYLRDISGAAAKRKARSRTVEA